MRLGEVLKAYRGMKGVSVRELAADIGIEYQSLYRLEAGRRPIDMTTWLIVTNWLAGNENG